MDSSAGLPTLLLALFTCGSSEEPITCDAGQFTVGQTASVTCNFHQKTIDSGHRIFVLHYPFSASQNFSGNDVLKCIHLHYSGPLCRMAEGFEFHSDITDGMTLTIPNVQEEFAGQYVCQIVPPDGRLIKTCNLTLTDTGMTLPGNETTSQQESSSWLYFTIVTSIIVCVLSIVAVVACVVFIRRKCTRQERRLSNQPQSAPLVGCTSSGCTNDYSVT